LRFDEVSFDEHTIRPRIGPDLAVLFGGLTGPDHISLRFYHRPKRSDRSKIFATVETDRFVAPIFRAFHICVYDVSVALWLVKLPVCLAMQLRNAIFHIAYFSLLFMWKMPEMENGGPMWTGI